MNSGITLNDRRDLLVSGVKSVESITDSEIVIFTEDGDLIIKGKELIPDEFDPASGMFRVNGQIDELGYRGGTRHLPDNLISRLFR